MKAKIALLAVGLLLSGCQAANVISAASGFSVTQQQLDSAENAYDGTALVSLHTYASWPRCAPGKALSVTNRCHDAALLKTMRAADKAVSQGFVSVQNQITSGNNTGAIAAWNTLQTALGAMKAIISGIGGI